MLVRNITKYGKERLQGRATVEMNTGPKEVDFKMR